MKHQQLCTVVLTANCKISRRNCVKYKNQRGISPRKIRIPRRNFAAEHSEISLPIITHKNQLTGVSRRKRRQSHFVLIYMYLFL